VRTRSEAGREFEIAALLFLQTQSPQDLVHHRRAKTEVRPSTHDAEHVLPLVVPEGGSHQLVPGEPHRLLLITPPILAIAPRQECART
jgi:hypothetical protein